MGIKVMLTNFSLALSVSCYYSITSSHINPPVCKWYLTYTSNNSLVTKVMCPFLILLLQTHSEMYASKASSPCGSVWSCLVSAGRVHSSSLLQGAPAFMDVTITSIGPWYCHWAWLLPVPSTASFKECCQLLLLLLLQYTTNVSMHSVPYSDYHHLHEGLLLHMDPQGTLAKAIWDLGKTVKISSLQPVLFLLVAY